MRHAILASLLTLTACEAPPLLLPVATAPKTEVLQPAALARASTPAAPAPMIDWPSLETEHKLVWPPSGCDAGMWSMSYELSYGQDRTSVTSTDDENSVGPAFHINHPENWHVTFAPETPDVQWAALTSPDGAEYEVRRIENGDATCSVAGRFDTLATQVRLERPSAGLVIRTRNANSLGVLALDEACNTTAARSVPAALLTVPIPTEAIGALRLNGQTAATLTLGSATRVFDTRGRIETMNSGPDLADPTVVWVALVDDSAAYLYTLDRASLAIRSSTTFELDGNWAPHILAGKMSGGYLAVRGGLGASHPGQERQLRIFDTRSFEVVGNLDMRVVDRPPLAWRWPSQGPPTAVYAKDNGLTVTTQRAPNVDAATFSVTRSKADQSFECEAHLAVPADADVRVVTGNNYTFEVFAKSATKRLGWELGGDCTVVRESEFELPKWSGVFQLTSNTAAPLAPMPSSDLAAANDLPCSAKNLTPNGVVTALGLRYGDFPNATCDGARPRHPAEQRLASEALIGTIDHLLISQTSTTTPSLRARDSRGRLVWQRDFSGIATISWNQDGTLRVDVLESTDAGHELTNQVISPHTGEVLLSESAPHALTAYLADLHRLRPTAPKQRTFTHHGLRITTDDTNFPYVRHRIEDRRTGAVLWEETENMGKSPGRINATVVGGYVVVSRYHVHGHEEQEVDNMEVLAWDISAQAVRGHFSIHR